ncbi:Radical SAM superfamily protein [Candidatus Tiddalikarchaeum anstoanum]|nr:Radical SAM superfamily protein [Candidatus Tiddalikarchaeum anstoanum]
MGKKIIGLSFPENNNTLGLEPSILNVLPPGDNVEYSRTNKRFNDAEVEKYLCSVYIAGVDEFKHWAMQQDTRKIIVGGYHPTMFPEAFLNFADKIVIGPCDDLEATLSQKNILFERSHYDGEKVGNAKYVSGRILRTIPHDGNVRIHGEIKSITENPSGEAEIIKDRILPGVLSFKNTPRYDLYDLRNNQQVIPDKKVDDLATSVNSSFGCPYRCDFCCTPVMFGPSIIAKPLDAFSREINVLKDRLDAADNVNSKNKFMFFRDENFPLLKDYRKRLEIANETGAKLYLFASADRITADVADAFSDNNVYMVCLGLEDPTKDYPKNKKLKDAVDRLKKNDIYTYLSFIVDPTKLVGVSNSKVEKGKEFYKLLYERFEELKPEMVCGNFLMPFPGTPLWDDYYWMVSEKDFNHYDSKTPFLIKNELVAAKMRYFMFEVQWRYYNSDMYNNEVRRFDVSDTLHLRFLELKSQFDNMLGLLHLRP